MSIHTASNIKKEKYSWGNMITVHDGAHQSFPLHPEHQNKIKALKAGESTSFMDETGRVVRAKHHDNGKITLTPPSASSSRTVAVDRDKLFEENIEEVEQIDELSGDTLKNYLKGNQQKRIHHDIVMSQKKFDVPYWAKPKSKKVLMQDPEYAASDAKYKKLTAYRKLAQSKLAGPTTTKRFANEEVEQIDEAYKVHTIGDYTFHSAPRKPEYEEHGDLEHVYAHVPRVAKLGISLIKSPGQYGKARHITITNNKNGQKSTHTVYQSDYDKHGQAHLLSVRSNSHERSSHFNPTVQAKHHKLLVAYLSNRMIREDVEQLDELSPKLIQRYRKKAVQDYNDAWLNFDNKRMKKRVKGINKADTANRLKLKSEEVEQVDNRRWNIQKAATRLTKEDVINRTLEKYLPKQSFYETLTNEEKLVYKLEGLSELHIITLLDLFNDLTEENQTRMLNQINTVEDINELLDFAIQNRGE